MTLQRLLRTLARLHRWILRAVQLAIFLTAGVSAFLLRFDFSIPECEYPHLIAGLCAWILAKVLCFHLFRLDCGWWRYASVPDLLRLAAANLCGSAVACAALLLFAPEGFPRSLYLLDFVLCSVMTAGIRLGVRVAAEFSRVQNTETKKRTLIYGAGHAGIALLREIHQNPALKYDVVGFIDDDPHKTGTRIQGTKIFGGGSALPSIAAHGIQVVLIAVPSATGPEMSRILEHCHAAGLPFKTVPGLAEIIEGSDLARQLRDVSVEDLLGRSTVRLEEDRISARLSDRTVLVTGAAGSIGSELCRQIARFRPAAIVGYEVAETPLFHLEQEMARSFPDVTFHPVIGSVQNQQHIGEVLDLYEPSIIYHAAAYKHVPMMEAHAFEAIENNVLGTLNVALAAARFGVDDFVMISSDKAVRPTNIMGATKRLAELVIRSLQDGSTKYVSVRFGNVLGSNGSVIPTFKQQIARGGPVTVTHPEMRRYFMTIPEACQLVLQSSTMGNGGEIFVLDMGQPVRIVDLARNLILLSGLRPDDDIRIEFTGVRPGEKLYEELHTMDEDTLPTYHDKIKIFAGSVILWTEMERYIERIEQVCASRNLNQLILLLKDLVPEYNPSADLLHRVLSVAPAPSSAALSRVN